MKIVATNIGCKRTITWGSKEFETGIFKSPVDHGVFLGSEDVENDDVIERKYHGGIDKACYAFSANQYEYWKEQFPHLEWNFGMFGENLTIEGFDERHVFIGDTFEVGEAIIEVSEPRQPCYKLNARFESNKMVKLFVEHGFCGSYFRVLKTGIVRPGDKLHMIKNGTPEISLYDVFKLIYTKENSDLRTVAINHPKLAQSTIDDLR